MSKLLKHFVPASEDGWEKGPDTQSGCCRKEHSKPRRDRKPVVELLRIKDHPAEERTTRTAQQTEDHEMAVMTQGYRIGDSKWKNRREAEKALGYKIRGQ